MNNPVGSRWSRRKRSRRILPPAILAATLLLPVFVGGQSLFAGDRDGSVMFSWALVVRSETGLSKTVDYQQNIIRLESGDRFKIYLKPRNACFIYLYLYDAQNNLFLIFPDDFENFAQNSQISTNYELPGINSWFYLDEARGVELFYLIASPRRLEELERSTLRYLAEQTTHGNDLQAVACKHDVVDEIKRLIKETSYLSDAAEKPVAVAGHFRGIREEHELNGLRIETTGIYVKTIRLQH